MGWVEPVSTVVTAVSLANDIGKSSSLIRKHANRLMYWLRHGSVSIPIFGAGGVGKSTVARIIAGATPLDIAAPYDESWLIEPVTLKGDVPGKLLVGPGQLERAARHWPELCKAASDGTAFGIINVVSYGYHSFAVQSFREHDEWRDGDDEDKFMAKYLEKRRTVELEMLQKLIDGVSSIKQPIWMVTLLNKQDLWWADRLKVRSYYEDGEYHALVRELATKAGTSNFQHEFVPASIAIGNLTSLKGEVLAQTTAGYDTATHLRYLQSLFAKLDELVEQGAPR